MSRVFVHGVGAVSPAGWGVASLAAAIQKDVPYPAVPLAHPDSSRMLTVRRVPAPNPIPAFFSHPRLRRTSPITQFAAGAALEAVSKSGLDNSRLGIVFSAFAGSVNYSKRFYAETLRDPATASPLVFPETVLNAPSSHLSALLCAGGRNYTLVGDQGEFLKALALGAEWLDRGIVDGCVVVAAEEVDWLTAGALDMFSPGACAAEGAGSIYLSREPSTVELVAVTEPQLYLQRRGRPAAIQGFQWPTAFQPASDDVLCDGTTGDADVDEIETARWRDWPGRLISTKQILGEGFAVAAAWQAIAGIHELSEQKYRRAFIGVCGTNEQTLGAVFQRAS